MSSTIVRLPVAAALPHEPTPGPTREPSIALQ